MKIGDRVIFSAKVLVGGQEALSSEVPITRSIDIQGKVLFVDENRINVEYTDPITGRLERMNKHRVELRRISSPPARKYELLLYISNIREEILDPTPDVNRINRNLYLLEREISKADTII